MFIHAAVAADLLDFTIRPWFVRKPQCSYRWRPQSNKTDLCADAVSAERFRRHVLQMLSPVMPEYVTPEARSRTAP